MAVTWLRGQSLTADAKETPVDTSAQALARLSRSMRNKITMMTWYQAKLSCSILLFQGAVLYF